MIKDYFLRLKDLRHDRLLYQTEKQKSTLSNEMNRQQDKYQAYIIEQMNDKNKIMAAFQMVRVLAHPIKLQMSSFMVKCTNTDTLTVFQGRSLSQPENSSRNGNNDSMINQVERLLLKYSVNTMARVVERGDLLQKRQAFRLLQQKRQMIKRIEKSGRIMYKFGIRLGWTVLKQFQRHKQKAIITCNNLFEDDFSMIYKEDVVKRQKGIADESYLSFMLDKENMHTQPYNCQHCRPTAQRDRQMAKMKEQISFLKTLLSQKNIEIMKKDELLKTMQLAGNDSADSSVNQSKNSSYYNQLDKYVTGGGKRIRKNISRGSQSSSQIPRQQISKELLSKYMKESFQLKETIDVARQLCLELRSKIGVAHRAQVLQIVKVLSFGDEVSMVDEY